MRTTIDAAGRVVVPKPVREAMGLRSGQEIDVVFTDGRIEIELAPVEVDIEVEGGWPRAVPRQDLPELTDEVVRDTLDSTRR